MNRAITPEKKKTALSNPTGFIGYPDQ